jgi:uncharacterized protein
LDAIYAPVASAEALRLLLIHKEQYWIAGPLGCKIAFTNRKSLCAPKRVFENSRQTMAKEGRSGLEAITAALAGGRQGQNAAAPAADSWNPPFCGDLDMRIGSDGTWYYLGTTIGRPALVKLFASVLRREGDKYYLVTPVEKCGITVDDAPFLAVELKVQCEERGPVLHFRTNVDDWVECGADHGLRFETETGTGGLRPYLHVRRGLWAKVTRSLFFDLVARGVEHDVDGRAMFGVFSSGVFFPMAPADALRELV